MTKPKINTWVDFGALLARIAYRIKDRHDNAVLFRRGDGKRWMVQARRPPCYIYYRKCDAVKKFESLRDAQEHVKQPASNGNAIDDKGKDVRRGV